jgi:hypothetical protein
MKFLPVTLLVHILSLLLWGISYNEPSSTASKGSYQQLTLTYGYISCSCAQWSESKYNDASLIKKREYMYIEPVNDSIAKLIIPPGDIPFSIQVIGEFKQGIGYPEGFKQVKGFAEPARVFKVSKVKLLQ